MSTCKIPEILSVQYFLSYSANTYLFKVNGRNNNKKSELGSKLTVKTPEDAIVKVEHISHFLLLTLSKYFFARYRVKTRTYGQKPA